jgi:diketogulonate reductase-like aldo/keto reductase
MLGWTVFSAFSIVVTSLLVQITSGQTNLYNGYARKRDGLIDDIPTITLSNTRLFPLVGLGVGNLQRNLVENVVYEGIKAEHRLRMIDTAHASQNEALVADGIVKGVRRFRKTENIEGRVQVHVVTKVWYTHLGYERTKLSVNESLESLGLAIKDPNVDLRVHMLIHWPACHDTIPWMHCEEEENQLPQYVKDAGPPPHLDKENAWKESWKALEDMYLSADNPALASIGVSNFLARDMEELLSFAREKPHMTQINVWSVFFDEALVDICNKHNIHMQLYNVMNGIVSNALSTPNAHHQILKVVNMLNKRKSSGDGRQVHMAQAILKWLINFGFSIVVRTSDLDKLRINSAVALSQVPALTEDELSTVAQASEAMISSEDLAEDVYVDIRFHATTKDMFLYFVAGKDNYQQIAFVPKGESYNERAHPYSRFRLYLATDPDVYHDYTVEGKYGDQVDYHVEL